MIECALRQTFLTLAGNKELRKMAGRYGLKLGASRFVAGESLSAAIQAVKMLNRKNMKATLDILGESTEAREQAVQAKIAYIRAIEHLQRKQLLSGVSLKPTALGLDIDQKFCYENIRQIVDQAHYNDVFVRIDMEDSAHLPATLDIFTQLRQQYENVGTVIQAYLYRSESDALRLQELNTNLRLVKGAYKEPARIAFPDKADVDANFRKLIRLHLDSGCFTAIATHDEAIIGWSLAYIQRKGISKDQYEFQFLYGIRPQLQEEIAVAGQPVRIYVPFGRAWYPYFMRRLAERPENVSFVLRGILRP